jgi:hypothetical protein
LLGKSWADATAVRVCAILLETLGLGVLGTPPFSGAFSRAFSRVGPPHTSFILAGWFVDDGAVFQTPQIKHSDASVLTTTDKHVNAVGAKTDIIDLFVVCDELRLGS